MDKYYSKASLKVGKAVQVFSTAKKEVEKAQELLHLGIKEDNKEAEMIKNQIRNLEASLKATQKRVSHKMGKIENNKQLLENLDKFQVKN